MTFSALCLLLEERTRVFREKATLVSTEHIFFPYPQKIVSVTLGSEKSPTPAPTLLRWLL